MDKINSGKNISYDSSLISRSPANSTRQTVNGNADRVSLSGSRSSIHENIKPSSLSSLKKSSSDDISEALEKGIKRNKNAWENLQKMDPEDRKSFLELAKSKTMTSGDDVMEGSTNYRLRDLLGTGKLPEKDYNGTTLLDNLVRMEKQKFAPGIDKQGTMNELMENLIEPNDIRDSITNNQDSHHRPRSGDFHCPQR